MDIWEILEIDETTDTRAIKKAYAKMLTKHHPEDEPEKFQEIKQAYDLALQYAKGVDSSDRIYDEPYFEGSESVNFDNPSSDETDSIFADFEELNRLDEAELEEVNQLIANLNSIRGPNITAEKLKQFVVDVDYEMMVNNVYFSNFIKKLREYLSSHDYFLIRRPHLFAIIKARFDHFYDEIQFHETDDCIYEFYNWLIEFEMHLKKRYENIKKNNPQYQIQESKYKYKWYKCPMILLYLVFFIFLFIATTPRTADNPSPPVPHIVNPIGINPYIDFSSRGYSREVELYIYQAVRSYLFDEYGKEFSTNGMMLNPDHHLGRGPWVTLIYFLVDDPEVTVFVVINYQIDGDSVEIAHISHVPLNLRENDDE